MNLRVKRRGANDVLSRDAEIIGNLAEVSGGEVLFEREAVVDILRIAAQCLS
nr:MAG TPA: hypothetical protein [Caudoviricetes sp.]